jgi:hypothetical protein
MDSERPLLLGPAPPVQRPLDTTQEGTVFVLRTWIDTCYARARAHRDQAVVCSTLHVCVTLPSMVAPMAATSFLVEGLRTTYVLVFLLVALACSALSLSCNFADRGAQHRQYFNRYSLLAKEIQFEVCRETDARSANLQRCIETWFHLAALAPAVHYKA